MYLINVKKLKIGDIIIVKGKSLASYLIRVATWSRETHAMLYIDKASIIHALSVDGVRTDNTQRLLFKSTKDVTCLRLVNNSNPQILIDACNYARQQSWASYSKVEAVKTRVPFLSNDTSNRQFCSRLIGVAFEKAGVNLVNRAAFCTPKNLRHSQKLEVIPNVLYKAAPEEIAFAKSDSPLDIQAKIAKEIMAFSRQITGADLQTEDQIIEHLIADPTHDQAIVTKCRDAGYFDIWKDEMQRNPWRYNPEHFLACIPKEQLEEIAQSETTEAIKHIILYHSANQRYVGIYETTKLLLAKEMAGLCDDLIEMHTKRYNTSNFALNLIAQ